MDTHIANYSVPDEDAQPMTARLPGESAAHTAATTPAAPEPEEHPQTSGPARPRKRRGLLLGVSLIAIAGIGGSLFLVSPYNHVVPVPGLTARVRHMAAAAGVQVPPAWLAQPPLLAPSAQLANVPLPPASGPVIQPHFTPTPAAGQVQELLALQSSRPAAEQSSKGPPAKDAQVKPPEPGAAMKPGAPPSGYVPHEPGSAAQGTASQKAAPEPVATTPAPGRGEQPPAAPARATATQTPDTAAPAAATHAAPAADLTATLLEAATPQPKPAAPGQNLEPKLKATAPAAPPTNKSPAPSTSQAAATRSAVNAVDQAQTLQAAPLSAPEQIQVIGLVTQLATEIRTLKAQDATLRQDVQRHDADTAKHIEDFERRLSISEARSALAAASDGAPAAASSATRPSSVPGAPVQLTSVAAATRGNAASAAPSEATAGTAKRYRVQAASPGLALLALVDRGGGEGAQLQVAVGDTVPGYGRVTAIGQRGTSWVVKTEHGSIN